MGCNEVARRRLNPRLVRIHFSYSINDIVGRFGIHKNTVRNWLKHGLPRIDDARPTLVHGQDLRAFLERRQQARKRKCPPGTFYCLKCREPRPPALGMVDFIEMTVTSGNLKALCAICGTVMNRRAQRARIDAVMPNLTVQFSQADSHIRERNEPSLNCDSGKERGISDETQRKE